MTQYQVSTPGPLVMKLIGLGILHHHFVYFKKGCVRKYSPFDATRSLTWTHGNR